MRHLCFPCSFLLPPPMPRVHITLHQYLSTLCYRRADWSLYSRGQTHPGVCSYPAGITTHPSVICSGHGSRLDYTASFPLETGH